MNNANQIPTTTISTNATTQLASIDLAALDGVTGGCGCGRRCAAQAASETGTGTGTGMETGTETGTETGMTADTGMAPETGMRMEPQPRAQRPLAGR